MKLYFVSNAEPGQRWQPTQDLAKPLGKECGTAAVAMNIGESGREGLASFLNGLETDLAGAEDADPTVMAPPQPQQAAKPPTIPHTSSGIVEWLLDEASVAQCENVLAAIGTRFGELAKGQRNAD